MLYKLDLYSKLDLYNKQYFNVKPLIVITKYIYLRVSNRIEGG
jgi:hypothetical protein